MPGHAFMREGFGSLLCAFVKVKPVLWWRSQGVGVSRAEIPTKKSFTQGVKTAQEGERFMFRQ